MKKVSAVIICLVALLMGCNKETSDTNPPLSDQSDPSFTFEFASVAATTRFIPFGDTLPGLTLCRGYEIQFSDTNELVMAACPGIVTAITPDTSGGQDIAVKYKPNSIYSFVYGGVSNIAVQINDTLNAGSILGKISSSGKIDFQVIKNNNEALCPETFGSTGFNTAIETAISKNNAFNPSDSVLQPCSAQSIFF